MTGAEPAARIGAAATALLWLSASSLLSGLPAPSGAGRDWGVEQRLYRDPVTGVQVREVAAGPSRSDNLYFHLSNFTADDRHLLFVSDRAGSWQLFRAEVGSWRITQVTDDPDVNARTACPDPRDARRAFCMRGAEVVSLDIFDFGSRKIGSIPSPHQGGFQQPTPSSDGKWLAVTKQRDEKNWEIGLVSTETGEYRTVITQGFRIGHVQHSPTDPVIFYVWETGGYAPQRTWLVGADGAANRPFYARTDPKTWLTPLKEWVTHEAWVAGTGEMTMVNDKLGVMLVSKDGSARVATEGSYWHAAASRDGKLIVMDDMQGRLWIAETATGSARIVATGLRDGVKEVHPHPSFDREGRYVQFHTGRERETVAVIDLKDLPPAPGTK